MLDNQIPTFNLKVVLKQTGLKADTLRAWERRYGLPKPVRSSGRHRLYSQRDIDTIKWLQTRQSEGLSISNAVELWQSLENEGNDPILMGEYSTLAASAVPAAVTGVRSLDDLKMLWVAACNSFDESASARILSEAFSLYAVEDVCQRIILDGMHQVGEGWYAGQIAVEQEHFASAIAKRQLDGLVSAAPPPTRQERILVGAAPGEQHDLILLTITLLLRRRGWDVIYLGANVPLESYETILDPSRFDLAILSAEQLFTAGSLRDVALLAQKVNLPLLFGGRIFRVTPGLSSRIPAHYLSEHLEAIPGIVAQALTSSAGMPSPTFPDTPHQKALVEFEEHASHIEMAVIQQMSPQMPVEFLEIANLNLTRDIQAALSLGDLNYLRQELNWIKGLIENRGLPGDILRIYLDAYSQAAANHLGQDSQLLVLWLEHYREDR
jgi:DNA-binding transcriptional MerR regulator